MTELEMMYIAKLSKYENPSEKLQQILWDEAVQQCAEISRINKGE